MKDTKTSKLSQITFQLFKALADLATTKQISEIRIQTITDKAGIHRSTFYRYFEDKEDLIERGTELFWDNITFKLEKYRKNHSSRMSNNNDTGYLPYFFNLLLGQRKILQSLMSPLGSSYFRMHTRSRLYMFIKEERLFSIENIKFRDHISAMICSSLLVTVEQLLIDADPKELLETYYIFITQGLTGFYPYLS